MGQVIYCYTSAFAFTIKGGEGKLGNLNRGSGIEVSSRNEWTYAEFIDCQIGNSELSVEMAHNVHTRAKEFF